MLAATQGGSTRAAAAPRPGHRPGHQRAEGRRRRRHGAHPGNRPGVGRHADPARGHRRAGPPSDLGGGEVRRRPGAGRLRRGPRRHRGRHLLEPVLLDRAGGSRRPADEQHGPLAGPSGHQEGPAAAWPGSRGTPTIRWSCCAGCGSTALPPIADGLSLAHMRAPEVLPPRRVRAHRVAPRADGLRDHAADGPGHGEPGVGVHVPDDRQPAPGHHRLRPAPGGRLADRPGEAARAGPDGRDRRDPPAARSPRSSGSRRARRSSPASTTPRPAAWARVRSPARTRRCRWGRPA